MIWNRLAAWCVPGRALSWGRLTKGDPFYLWGYPTLTEINAGTDLTGYLELDGWDPADQLDPGEMY